MPVAVWQALQEPFLLRALAGGLCLAIAAAPLGVFLVMRRMSLIVDAVGHAILPGAAGAAALGAGSSLALSAGAAATGVGVFAVAGWASRVLRLPEDAGFAVFYLGALSVGVVLASGVGLDLERLLFGAVLALDDGALALCLAAVPVSLLGLALLHRPLLYDTLDPAWLPARAGRLVRAGFFGLLALVTVACFHALGALMAVGLAILPAIAARHLAGSVPARIGAAVAVGCMGVAGGLLMSLLADVAAGASIVLVLTGLVVGCALLGPHDSVRSRQAMPEPGA